MGCRGSWQPVFQVENNFEGKKGRGGRLGSGGGRLERNRSALGLLPRSHWFGGDKGSREWLTRSTGDPFGDFCRIVGGQNDLPGSGKPKKPAGR